MTDATKQIDVQIVTLPRLRVASLYAFGPQPETAAWTKLTTWAGPRGLLDDPEHHRIFGFNNPNPSAGSPNYGYEFWIEIGPDVEPDGEARLTEFDGGLYAVTRVEPIAEPYDDIPAGWMALNRWLEDSAYTLGRHQWLEQHIDVPGDPDGFSLDLYMPIEE